jgi:hypothetical protein
MKLFGFKINGYLVIAALIIATLMSGSTCSGCMKCSTMEAMTLLGDVGKQVTKFKMGSLEKIPSSYSTNHEGTTNDPLLFNKNKKSMDGCLNNQSNYFTREGCVHVTDEQKNFLSSRGGNHK